MRLRPTRQSVQLSPVSPLRMARRQFFSEATETNAQPNLLKISSHENFTRPASPATRPASQIQRVGQRRNWTLLNLFSTDCSNRKEKFDSYLTDGLGAWDNTWHHLTRFANGVTRFLWPVRRNRSLCLCWHKKIRPRHWIHVKNMLQSFFRNTNTSVNGTSRCPWSLSSTNTPVEETP